jgi:hypothetical protein
MLDENDNILLVKRVDSGLPFASSEIRHCSQCNTEVYCTPASLQQADNPKLVCTQCFQKIYREGMKITFPNQEVIQEMSEALGPITENEIKATIEQFKEQLKIQRNIKKAELQ